ncbi:MCE family protein [Mycobacterium heckeshornense]|uniref:MCE family protein n=1 Tax=Mycobacterium TaxID=1763 RepID=UPI0007054425|nr:MULTISPECIES: MlaD family protein [Mycobacterium]MCV7036894.1 MCE family protein [Mycobacterium heckeshornense]GBE68214.1 mammalian cell entry protein [Mycobacterium sp. MFM001]
MLTRAIRVQVLVFTVVTVLAMIALGWHYLRLPSVAGMGQYTLEVELPTSGGLYPTANVTYRGITIGKVASVEPTKRGVRASVRISDQYKIPIDASANVHSVSAIGEQYLDIVSPGNPGKYFTPGQTITKSTVPSPIGPALGTVYHTLDVLPKDKITALLNETAQAVGGLGPALQRLVDSTQATVGDFKLNLGDVNDIIQNSAPIIDSQVDSADPIERWAHNLNILDAQAAEKDQNLKSILTQAAPTADQINTVLSDVRETLPQTLANVAIVADLLKRYNKNIEQFLVILPQVPAFGETVTAPYPDSLSLSFNTPINVTPACLTGFLPPPLWRSPSDETPGQLTTRYCKIPKEAPNAVRGARNYPCVDVPGKRAATPRECRSNEPYIPLGTNPWYGDPDQIRNCPAPAARCDQPVQPGEVIPAPSINNGLNPLPANQVPGTPPPHSDPLQRPSQGTVRCNGQQPNPCIYIPSGLTAFYSPQSGEVVGPHGVRYTVEDSNNAGDNGWKEMLGPMPGS